MKKVSELAGLKFVAKIELVRYRFPVAKKDIVPGKMSIVVVKLLKIVEGDVPDAFCLGHDSDPCGVQFIIKGYNIPKMEMDQTYLMTGTLVKDEQWGYQYNVSDVHLDYDLTKLEDQNKFLQFFLTENQISMLFSMYDNPIRLLENKQIGDLKKIKGIGPATALKMCTKYEECKNSGRAYVVLSELGLTKNAIDKIVKHYGSVDIAIDAVESNPYILIRDVRGYGWEKADAIAQKKGFATDSKERSQAYAQYYLQEQADINGNSCVPIDDLINNVCSKCFPLSKELAGSYIKELTANDAQFEEYMKEYVETRKEGEHLLFYYNLETRKIGLFWYRVIEKQIYYEFFRLHNAKSKNVFDKEICEEAIKECEEEQGFTYTEEQKAAIWMTLNNNLSIITGSAGCVDSDTEFLTTIDGKNFFWKKINEYTDGDYVTCVDNLEDGDFYYEKPLKYIKEPCEKFYHFVTDDIDQMLSEDHICIIFDNIKNVFIEKTCKELVQDIKNNPGAHRYNICYTSELYSCFRSYPTEVEECIISEGYKYCFQVSSHYFLARRNGKITVLHNCGKSTTLKPLVKILEKQNLTVEQCALSGRASSLLSEVTGVEGKTIHRLLHYQVETGQFAYNSFRPIPADVVILDETSMVGEELFLSLISAVQSGSRFIMLGDVKQLPPLAVGNILSDSLKSGYIPTTVLTKIHRQAMKSGITSQAVQISCGEGIIKNNFTGSEVRGELQDFKITAASDIALIHYEIIKEFKRLYIGKKIPADQLQVIVPIKMKGDTSCRVLNEVIQEIVNPGNENKAVTMIFTDNGSKYTVKFKPKDRVIINRNNYHAIGVDGKEHAVFNGNLGVIKEITDDVMIVSIIGEDADLMFTRENWYDINLAYAITVHKLQGSQAPYTIVGIDYSSYALLSRELVYTAITRATKYCSLITQPKALNLAIHTSAIKTKITWLKDDLLKAIVEEQLNPEKGTAEDVRLVFDFDS